MNVDCSVCGTQFYLRPSAYKRGTRLCSPECRNSRQNIEARFWKRVDKTGDCWVWKGPKVGNGYGKVGYKGRTARANRVSWELANGPIPDGMMVCHKCDNPSCVRPDHLFLGSVVENNSDKQEKGRQVRGETAGASVLTEEQVREIKRRYAAGHTTLGKLSIEYGVHTSQIHHIVKGRNWRHVVV